jgi:hypothetical protein
MPSNQEDKLPQASALRAIPSGGDSFQRGCKYLQDRANVLLEEYRRPGTSDQRLRQIIIELQNLNAHYKSIGCQAVFGDMVREIPRPPLPGPVKYPVPINPVLK